jgi:uncharacterized protein YigA (DUF484 family)
MTKLVTPNFEDLELDAELVKDYLEQTPSFFTDYPELVTQLRIPHAIHGTTSLLERRQEIQRSKILQMEEELNTLMVNARQNEVIFRAVSDMYLGLVGGDSVAKLDETVSDVCKDLLFLAQFRLLQPEDEAYIHLQAKLDGNPSYLGRLYPEIMETVFDGFAQSVALVELNYMVGEEEIIFGIAAFASSSIHHFHPRMDTLFIDQLGQLLSKHVVHLTC